MKLIKPKQISGEIMTLLDEADKEVIIISPYVKVTEWKKLENTFQKLKLRNVDVKFYFRENENKTLYEIENLGFKAVPIENLHCKVYMNENYGIVSSMNLYKYSDENSLDIAYKTDNAEDYNELRDFYDRYIKESFNNTIIDLSDFLEKLKYKLNIELNSEFTNVIVDLDENRININTSNNNYWFGFERTNGNNLFWINGIITEEQYQYAIHLDDEFTKKFELEVELFDSEKTNGYNMIALEDSFDVRSSSISEVYQIDADRFLEKITKFVERTETFRSLFGQIRAQTW